MMIEASNRVARIKIVSYIHKTTKWLITGNIIHIIIDSIIFYIEKARGRYFLDNILEVVSAGEGGGGGLGGCGKYLSLSPSSRESKKGSRLSLRSLFVGEARGSKLISGSHLVRVARR